MRFGPLTIQAPVLLLGLLAAAIPVLLHLLAKVRAPQMYFPTLRFLRRSMDKTARRRRIQHWLLLLLRMAALAALAMAVAQPLVQPDNPMHGSDTDTAAVVILDNSLSMTARAAAAAGQTRFDQAKSAAERLLVDHNFAQVGLIVTNGPPIDGPAVMLNPDKQRDRLKTVRPGTGRADLVTAVLSAEKMLADSDLRGSPNREIYLFTDLQETSAAPLYALAGDIARDRLRPPLLVIAPAASGGRAAGPPRTPMNLAVTKIEMIEPGVMADQPVTFNVTVRNFSPENLPAKAAVDLFVDGQDRGVRQAIAVINPASSRVLQFAVSFHEPGIHTGWFQVQPDGEGAADKDDLPADDRRHFAVNVADRVNVLLVKSHHELDRSEDPGFFIRRMVSTRLANEAAVPFQLTEVAAAALTAAEELSATLLAGRDVVVTSDLSDLRLPWLGAGGAGSLATSQPNDSTVDPMAALRQYVRDGGTWMIFLGPSADLANYNAWLTGPSADKQPPLLDGRLERYVGNATGGQAADDQAPPVIQWVDESDPMFAGYYPTQTPYRRVQVYRHAVVRLPPGSASRPIARLDNGDPLVIATPYGRGRVLLFATAATGRWTNWLAKAQGLVIRQAMQASASRGSGGGEASVREHFENEPITLDLGRRARLASSQSDGTLPGKQAGPLRVQVRLPDGAMVELKSSAGGSSAMPFTRTDQLGPYRWQAFGSSSDHPIAEGAFVVNVPEEESNLAALPSPRLAQMLPGRVVEVGDSVEQLAQKVAEHRQGSPLWPYLFAAVLVMLAIEARIANRSRAALPADGEVRKLIPGPAR